MLSVSHQNCQTGVGIMRIETIQTGWTLVSGSVPDRSKHRWKKAYSRLFQSRDNRIKVPVMSRVESAKHQLEGKKIDCILMTHHINIGQIIIQVRKQTYRT